MDKTKKEKTMEEGSEAKRLLSSGHLTLIQLGPCVKAASWR